MQDPEYLAQLNHGGNIGVLLGNGLVTIDLDRDEAVEPFLSLNPKLRETLRTRRVRGCNLWLLIKGVYPKAAKIKTRIGEDWGEWRANGNQTVIHGEAIDKRKGEVLPTSYKIIREAKPENPPVGGNQSVPGHETSRNLSELNEQARSFLRSRGEGGSRSHGLTEELSFVMTGGLTQ